MGLNAVKMLGISITTSFKKEILEEVRKYLSQNPKSKIQNPKNQGKPLIIVTPNPEQVVLAQKDKRFAQILNQADVAIPDGIGLVAAMRLLKKLSAVSCQLSALKRIPGVELMEDLVAMAARRGDAISLIGGRGGVAVRALECLRQKYPGLTGWAMEPEELDVGHLGNLGNLGEKIKKTNTRLVFVGLGAPKQEYVMARLARQLSFRPPSRNPGKKGWIPGQARDDSRVVLMSVGGAFDIIAGRTPRAPRAIQAIHLEWLWRLVREPWRLRRQLALLQFIWLVLRQKLSV